MPTGSDVGCCENVAPMEQRAPRVNEKSCLTKKRYVELVQLGLIASEELTKHGLQRNEYCEFGSIMQKIMQLD